LQRDSSIRRWAQQELMRAEHFASQYTVFAEGQIVVLDGDRVIGQGSGFFTDFDFEHPAHSLRRDSATTSTFAPTTRQARTTTAPTSAYIPTIAGAGIGKQIYRARKDLVRRYNKRGIVGGGAAARLRAATKHQLSVHDYVRRVVAGELRDTTLTFQLKRGLCRARTCSRTTSRTQRPTTGRR
jgi:hypothetical protein